MSLSLTDMQIKAMYEQQGVAVEDIAEAMELDPLAVKDALLRGSTKYRLSVRKGKEDITDDEYTDLLDGYKQLALHSPNDFIREKASRFLILNRKGHYDTQVAAPNTGAGALQINQYIIQVREKTQRAMEAAKEQIVEIPAEAINI